MKPSRTAALTGGIASGKSTVAAMFQELGAHLIDADTIARQVVEPEQPAWSEIVEAFGKEILLDNGQLDRKQLGTVVFSSSEKRQALERIIHPRVIAEVDRQEDAFRQSHPGGIVIVGVRVLIEAKMHTKYTTILVVYVPEEIQMRRVMARDGLSEDDARRRIMTQMPLVEKCAYASHIISNEGTLEQTRKQVQSIYQELFH
jgi:dephospho-CoA kinase